MLNNASVMGRITKDIELKQTTEKGTYYVQFCIACKRDIQKDTTDFIDCVAWTKTAQFISQYFKKGDRIIVTGMITTRITGTGENTRKYTEILVSNAQFVELRDNTQAQAQPTQAPAPTPPQVQTDAAQYDTGLDQNTDALPFDIGF